MLQTPHEVAAGLRDLANWLDEHPAHRPFITRYASAIDIYPPDKESFVALARDMAPCAKECDRGLVNAYLRKEFRGGVRLLGAMYKWQWDPLLEEGADV